MKKTKPLVIRGVITLPQLLAALAAVGRINSVR
jgi:hypothetical protein